jgi:AcrR family transcriptional regulator
MTRSGRRRLTPEASRLAALEAARDLLIEAGPQAVTLKAVAGRIGRTHANLLHHFGSASGLQRELAAFHAQAICTQIGEQIHKLKGGYIGPRDLVDLIFEHFDRGGAGALAAWMLLSAAMRTRFTRWWRLYTGWSTKWAKVAMMTAICTS